MAIGLTARTLLFAAAPPDDGTSAHQPASDKTDGKTSASKPRAALIFAFTANLKYSHDWLNVNDFKSLVESADALSILTEAINRHTGDEGREKIDALKKQVSELSAAAKASDAARAQRAIAAIPLALQTIGQTAIAPSPAAVKKTTAGFNPLMHTIDGTFTDAKTSLATGETEEAKAYISALADLGQWLVADRAGEQWHQQAGELATAAREVAASSETDPKALRAAFHGIYNRCEACHHRNR
jgi:hypothetical protein